MGWRILDSRARRGLLLGFVVGASAADLRAQLAGPSAHPNFIFFRYASLTSLSVFGAYGQGRWLGFVGMIAVALAAASDGWYGQLYLQSNMRLGKVATYLSTAYYEPLGANGARQIKVNPALVMWRVFRRLEAGGAYVFLGSVRSKDIHQLGPALQFAVPNGRVTFELLKRLHNSRIDLRATFQAYR